MWKTSTAALTLSLAIAGVLAACAGPSVTAGDAATPADDELVLIGSHDFAFEDLTNDLDTMGYSVGVDAAALTPSTDLVLLVVNGLDGPMPSTRQAVAALVGKTVPRVAIAITEADEQDDPELRALIALEAGELLASFGITPVDAKYLVLWPGSETAAVIDRHLARPPRDYPPTNPENR